MIEREVAKISIVGSRLASTPGLAARMFTVLAREGINIDCISSSEMKVACVISAAHLDRAVRAVHDEFFPQHASGGEWRSRTRSAKPDGTEETRGRRTRGNRDGRAAVHRGARGLTPGSTWRGSGPASDRPGGATETRRRGAYRLGFRRGLPTWWSTTPAPGRAPRILFSGLDASVAGEVEEAFAAAGHIVVSNARNHRMDTVVPLLVPEINPDHLGLLPAQARAKGWRGWLVTNPNCSTVVLTMALAPLRQFGLRSALVTTLQAVSGAGYPGRGVA